MTVLQDNSQYKYRAEFYTSQQVELKNGRTVTQDVLAFKRWIKFQTAGEKFRNAVPGFNETTDLIINIREINNDPINVLMDTSFYTVKLNNREYSIYSCSPNLRIGGDGYHIIALRAKERSV